MFDTLPTLLSGTEQVVMASGMVGGADVSSQLQNYFDIAQGKGLPLIIPKSDNGLAYKVSKIMRVWTGASIISNGAVLDFQTDHSATGIGLFCGSESSTAGISSFHLTGLRLISTNATARNGVYGLLSVFNSKKFVIYDCISGDFDIANSGGESTGYFFMNSNDFDVQLPKIYNTFADGLHVSRGCQNFHISTTLVSGAQDDAIAIVSNKQDGAGPIYGPCKNFTINNFIVVNSTVLGNGIACVGAQDGSITNGSVYNVPTSGIVVAQANYGGIINPARLTFTNVNINGAASTSGCIRVGNATDIAFSNIIATGGYAGMTILSSANTACSNMRISSTGAAQYGIYDDAASSRTIVSGCILNGNTAGAILLQGTGSVALAGSNITA